MTSTSEFEFQLEEFLDSQKGTFHQNRNALSFSEFLELVSKNPQQYTRNSALYLRTMIDWFGVEEHTDEFGFTTKTYKVFEQVQGKNKTKIVGQHRAQEQIVKVIDQFVRQGKIDKLILLHGPNGSSKSSTAEALASAMEIYSQSAEGALYKFSWIFPTDKVGLDGLGSIDYGKKIGFGNSEKTKFEGSFAHLADDEILCKIGSEMKENPLFLLSKTIRLKILSKLVDKNFEIPTHIEHGELSAKSKKIFDALYSAYQGDLNKVFRHIQVERFYISSRYRVSAVTVEPQMNIDAQDKQVTMDRNMSNIPTVLQNIRFFEPTGDLIDANRGIIEFADLLKRPLEAFKYLLTTVEKMSVNLISGQADLDLLMIASSNEKHLDAFKATPDWPSFKGRFELVRVPYLLNYKLEERIYEEDIRIVKKIKPVSKHALKALSKWAVLTRLRNPDPEQYPEEARALIQKIDPYTKLGLFAGDDAPAHFSEDERHLLKRHKSQLLEESQSTVAYEGRFGASPREMKMLLYFASQNTKRDSVSAVAIFEEIANLIQDRSVYEYLQFEPRTGYHNVEEFLSTLKLEYAHNFHQEFLAALGFFDERQYQTAFSKYLKHVVAFIKAEKVENEITGKFEAPSDTLMTEMEKFLSSPEESKTFRQNLVSKIASWRVSNPKETLLVPKLFEKEISEIGSRIYEGKQSEIALIRNTMLMWSNDDYGNSPKELLDSCENCFERMYTLYGYTKHTVWESLVFSRSLAVKMGPNL